ncbi:MAG: hypothetical protein AB1665_09225 [Candidatus Thermoplasmatota archaeon]
MEKEEWKVSFELKDGDLEAVEAFLGRLRQPNTFESFRDGIVVTSPSKDEAFKVGQWVRLRALRDRQPFYEVTGYRDGRIVYRSRCRFCRAGQGDHYRHL